MVMHCSSKEALIPQCIAVGVNQSFV